MKVTVEVTKIFNDRPDALRGATNVILEDGEGERFIIKNVRVLEGEQGLFVSLPSRRNVNNEYREICHPLSSSLRNRMMDGVLKAYQAAVEADRQGGPSPAA